MIIRKICAIENNSSITKKCIIQANFDIVLTVSLKLFCITCIKSVLVKTNSAS